MADKSLVCSSGSYTAIGAASILAFSIAAASGSYAVTGTAVSFVKGHPLTAVSGTYAINGSAIQSRRISAAPAGYLLNGTAITLTKSNKYVFASAAGSYAITGTTATKLERAVPSDRGGYILTGSTVNLIRSSAAFIIPINSGGYTLTGTVANLLSTVTIDSGDYRLTGTDATFRKGKSLLIGSGSYTVNGFPGTRLEQSRHFPIGIGSYGITGAVTTLRYSNSKNIFIVINSSNYTLAGSTANLLMARRFDAVSGTYTINDGHTVFKKQYDPGSYNLTGTDVLFTVLNRRLTAASGSYTISGVTAQLVYSIRRLVVASGQYILASTVTTTNKAYLLTNPTGFYSVTGSGVTLRATRIMVDSGSYSITDGGTNVRASRVGRWRNQSRQPAATTAQPKVTDNWDPQQGASGV